ncbi:hypothetical protein M0805_003575 [Coniferiporia weirii]|nr:hypothetical protein M0805_003575 [Coniferiporia weirii]
MHARNPYRTQIDFVSLAEVFPPLKPLLIKSVSGAVSIDFKDVNAQRKLTEALLFRDFALKLSLPEGRLCPPVPNRLNYLLWIQDLLSETFRSLVPATDVIGIDIGTGASAIYPLLGCRLEPSWQFVGTEVDSTSFDSASRNVEQNGLETRITVLKTSPSKPLLAPLHSDSDTRYAFTMCNPPFYGSAAEVARSADGKALGPNAVCTGAEVEMITPGGEEAFVQRMVTESLERRVGERCLWFTSMLGKFSSVGAVVGSLRAYKIDNYALTELVQGQTRRWAIAWSFADARVPDTLARALPSAHHALFPPPNTLRQPLHTLTSIGSHTPISHHTLSQILMSVLEGLDDVITETSGLTVDHSPGWRVDPTADAVTEGSNNFTETESGHEAFRLQVSAARNTWSRSARRRRGKDIAPTTEGRSLANTEDMAIDPGPRQMPPSTTPALMVDICAVRVPPPVPTQTSQGRAKWELRGRGGVVEGADTVETWTLECTWRHGRDRALFEGFWGHVCRRMGAAFNSCFSELGGTSTIACN